MGSESGWLKHRYGYSSQSEADLALCSILAFWTGKDSEWIDRLFRKSGLMRGKWDEYRGDQTYGQLTIAKAIADTKDVWKRSHKKRKQTSQKKTASFNETTKNTNNVNLFEEFNKKHAVIMVGGKCQIMNEIIDPVFNRADITFSSINDFINRYSNLILHYTDE